jgi:hypothetical protein
VRFGAGTLEKKMFLRMDGMGTITDIEFGNLRGPEGIELGIAGNYGAKFFNPAKQLKAIVNFDVLQSDGMIPTDIVRQTPLNALMFFRHSDWSEYDSLFDSRGKESWRTPFSSLTSTFGSFSKDGAPSFVFVRNDKKCCTIEARNVSGHQIWQIPAQWAVHIAFLGSDATPKMVVDQPGTHHGTTVKLLGLGAEGQRLSDPEPNIAFFGFSAAQWPGVCEHCLLISEDQKFVLITPDTATSVTSLSPASYVSDTRSAAVRFRQNEPSMFAVIGRVEYKTFQKIAFRGELFVFNFQGKLIYNEVLPGDAQALSAIPSSDGKRQILLVGGENEVWEFELMR